MKVKLLTLLAASRDFWAQNAPKQVCGQSFVQDPAGGACGVPIWPSWI